MENNLAFWNAVELENRKSTRRQFLISIGAIASAIGLSGIRAASANESGLRFFVIGDWGSDGQDGQAKVATAMKQFAKAFPPDFIVSVGDNFYSRGVNSPSDPHWNKSFEAIYNTPELRCPWYITLGNHDWRGDVGAEISYHQLDPRWILPSAYYVRREPLKGSERADFFFLDTTSIEGENWIQAYFDQQLNWLETQLSESKAKWKIVIGHHTIFSSGKHGRTNPFADRLQPLIEKYSVNAYFCGHDHDLEHLRKNDIDYFVVGSSANTRSMDGEKIKENGSKFAASTIGFAMVSIDSERMTTEFISADENIIYDTTVSYSG